MKSVILILSAIVIMLFAAATLGAINDFRSRNYTEPRIITTAPAITSADVVLTQDLFSDATANVVITSNSTGDAPIPFSYVANTKTLTISGLAADSTRLLTIVYRIDALGDYPGVGIASRFWPAFLFLGIFGLIGGAIYAIFARRGGDE